MAVGHVENDPDQAHMMVRLLTWCAKVRLEASTYCLGDAKNRSAVV